MIRFIITLVLALVSQVLFSQNVFEKFENNDEVTTVIVSKKMFEMMGRVKVDSKDPQTQQFLNLVKKLENLKVYTTSNLKLGAELKLAAEKYLKTANLEELMRINDSGKNVRILIRTGAKDTQVRELFMLIEGSAKDKETVILSLTGDFDLNEISALTDQMNLPGGDELKKASKGKK
jgi:predicted AAA+ superfamily ATPase